MTPSRQAALLSPGLRPILSLDFTRGLYSFGRQKVAQPSDIPGWSFTRASPKTALTSTGGLVSFVTGVPAITDLGFLIEESRTNSFLNSAIGATQIVTTTAASWTLSFWGTGSITLSGAATGTLTGTGANNRVFLTVTATAGSAVMTVSGSVTNVQLEAGAFASSYIATTSTAATRAADVAAITFTGLSASALSAAVEAYPQLGLSYSARALEIKDASTNLLDLQLTSSEVPQVLGSGLTATTVGGALATSKLKIAAAVAGGAVRGTANGATPVAIVGTLTMGAITTVVLGDVSGGGRTIDGYLARMALFPTTLPDGQIQRLTQ